MAGWGIGGETGQDKSSLNVQTSSGGDWTGATINFSGSNKMLSYAIVGLIVLALWPRRRRRK